MSYIIEIYKISKYYACSFQNYLILVKVSFSIKQEKYILIFVIAWFILNKVKVFFFLLNTEILMPVSYEVI